MPTKNLVPAATATVADEMLELIGLSRFAYNHLIALALELTILVAFYTAARLVALRLLSRLTRRLAERPGQSGPSSGRTRTLMGLTTSIVNFVLGFVFLVSALGLLGVNIAAIVGTASVAGLAFGFGAQKLIKDVMTGFFLLLEDQYAVGDYVTIGAVSGTVEELAMRITRIRDDDGRLHILSNGDIASVSNHSRGPILGTFEIGVSAAVDPNAAAAALVPALKAVSESLELAEAARVDGISAADAAKTTLRIVFRTAVGRRPAQVLPALRETARRALVEAGIALG